MMDEIRRRILIKRFLVLPLLIVFLTIVLLVFGCSRFTASSNYRISCLDEGWSIFRDNTVLTEISLSEYRIGSSKRGERISISNTITVPEHTTIMFRSKHEAVDMFIDGRKVYSYGRDYLDNGSFIPKRYNIINLSPYAATHKILITYTLGEDDSVKKISPIFFGKRTDLIRAFFSYKRISMFIGSFLVIYSCVLFSLWIYLFLNKSNALQIYNGAFFSMLLGCYIFSKNDILWFIGNHEMLFSIMEYLSLYLIPLGLVVLLHSIRPQVAPEKQKIIIMVNVLIPVFTLVMHFCGILHLNRFVYLVGIVAITETVILFPPLVKDVGKQFKQNLEIDYYVGLDAEYYLILGFVIMVVLGVLEMIVSPIFKISNNLTDTRLFPTVDSLELGMLIFMLCDFIYYFMNGINHMSADMIKKQLEGLAYTDALTGLMNRAACASLLTTKEKEYGLVSLDLDKLKYVNDTLGHAEGDRMIKTFATFLKNSFNSAEIVARTGGDEFVAVFFDASIEDIEECVTKLNSKMELFNKKNDAFILSASIGYAFSNEVEGNRVEDVFYLADQRMYKMKEAHHG